MTHRHDPAPPGKPQPGELPVEPDRGALPPGALEEDDPADTPVPT